MSATTQRRALTTVDLKWQGDYVKATYITFIRTAKSESGKTMIWSVREDADKEILGFVRWFGRWRTYAFDAEPNMVFEKTCLREIAQFCEELTTMHKSKKKLSKENTKGIGL